MDRQVPRGRWGPNSRQVPSLTPCDTFHPDDHHVSMGHRVPKGRQGPSGRHVPSLTPRSRGVIGLVQSVFFVFGQPKLKILVCEILN